MAIKSALLWIMGGFACRLLRSTIIVSMLWYKVESKNRRNAQKWAFFLFINWFSYAKTAQQTIQEVQTKEILNIVANDERIAQDKKEPTLEMGVAFCLRKGQRNRNRSPGNLKKGCTPLLFWYFRRCFFPWWCQRDVSFLNPFWGQPHHRCDRDGQPALWRTSLSLGD